MRGPTSVLSLGDLAVGPHNVELRRPVIARVEGLNLHRDFPESRFNYWEVRSELACLLETINSCDEQKRETHSHDVKRSSD